MNSSRPNIFEIILLPFPLVKRRVTSVEILAVQIILRDTQSVAEALIMNDLAFAEEFYWIAHVGVVDEPQDIVVGRSCLLLCYYHVFATTLSVALRRHLSQRARLLYV